MSALDSSNFINFAFSFLLKKIIVPTDYHNQVEAVKEMQTDDFTGLIDSLTDFMIASATVDFAIETDNDKFTKTLKKWMERVNQDYPQIPSGMKEVSKEYFKERWKYSSFPILKIADWKAIDGILVPTKMFFVDGRSIYSKEIEEGKEDIKVTNYDYYIGSDTEDAKYKLEKNCIFARPFGRWFDEYPIPYLIKRGIYHNWKIISSLKGMQSKILEQIIPYIMLIKKGTEGLAKEGIKTYSQPELDGVLDAIKSLKKEMQKYPLDTPARATNFDEKIEHLIPDLKTIMQPILFAQAERNILSGLGFIDVIQGISDTRKESVLNPKAFVTEIKSGVDGFKGILKELVFLIQEVNKKHIKYMNSEFYIYASSVQPFMTDDFKNQMRLLWERGQLSNQSYAEIVGEVEYRTEVARRKKEAVNGDEYTMYPHLTKNDEDKGIDIVGEEPEQKDTDKNGKPIPTDKTDDKEKFDVGKKQAIVKCPKCKNIFNMLAESEAGMGWVKCPRCEKAVTQKDLVTAPYTRIAELPANVKKQLSPKKQRDWMQIFNNAYRFYMKKFKDAKKAETLAFRTAWSQIRRVKAKNKILKKKK